MLQEGEATKRLLSLTDLLANIQTQRPRFYPESDRDKNSHMITSFRIDCTKHDKHKQPRHRLWTLSFSLLLYIFKRRL